MSITLAKEDLGSAIQHGANLAELDKLAAHMEKTCRVVSGHSLEIKMLTNQIALLEARLIRELAERQSCEQILQTKSARDSQILAKQQEQLAAAKETFVALKNDNMRLTNDNVRLLAEKAEALEQVAELKSQKLADDDIIHQQREKLRTADEQIARLTAANKTSIHKFTDLQSQLVVFDQKMQQIEAEIALTRKQDADKQNIIGDLESRIATLQAEIHASNQSNEKLRQQSVQQQKQLWGRLHQEQNLTSEKDLLIADKEKLISGYKRLLKGTNAELDIANQTTYQVLELSNAEHNAHIETIAELKRANRTIRSQEKRLKKAQIQLEKLLETINSVLNKHPYTPTLCPSYVFRHDHLIPFATQCQAIIALIVKDGTAAKLNSSEVKEAKLEPVNKAAGQDVVNLFIAAHNSHIDTLNSLKRAHKTIKSQTKRLTEAQGMLDKLQIDINKAQHRYLHPKFLMKGHNAYKIDSTLIADCCKAIAI
jgi:hypothetical protein